jgi:hypothetical protein
MENIKFEKIPALRVDLEQVGCPGFYVLIVPDPRNGPKYRDFYIANDDFGPIEWMFGCEVFCDNEAAEIALTQGPDYKTTWEDNRKWKN